MLSSLCLLTQWPYPESKRNKLTTIFFISRLRFADFFMAQLAFNFSCPILQKTIHLNRQHNQSLLADVGARTPDMARKRNSGDKHSIIFIRHSLTRIFRNLVFVNIIIGVIWWVAPYTPGPFQPPNDVYIQWLGIFLLIVMILALLLRNSGFVQAKSNHILLAIPFFRVKIPYENVENVRMVQFRDLYDRKKMSWTEKRFLNPYFPKTVATINLNKFPISEGLLRIFLPNYLFIPREKGRGFVIYTKFYLEFNTEVDSRLNATRSLGTGKPAKDKDIEINGYFDIFSE